MRLLKTGVVVVVAVVAVAVVVGCDRLSRSAADEECGWRRLT